MVPTTTQPEALTSQLPLPAILNNQEVITLVSSINQCPFLHPQCHFPNLSHHHYMSVLLQQPLSSTISLLCSTSDIFENAKSFMICHCLNSSVFSPLLLAKGSKVFNMVYKTSKAWFQYIPSLISCFLSSSSVLVVWISFTSQSLHTPDWSRLSCTLFPRPAAQFSPCLSI